MDASPRAAAEDPEAPSPVGRVSHLMSVRLLGVKEPRVNDSIRIADLPNHVAKKLAQFDADGDGEISIEEILTAGAEVEHLRYKVRPLCGTPRAPDGC